MPSQLSSQPSTPTANRYTPSAPTTTERYSTWRDTERTTPSRSRVIEVAIATLPMTRMAAPVMR